MIVLFPMKVHKNMYDIQKDTTATCSQWEYLSSRWLPDVTFATNSAPRKWPCAVAISADGLVRRLYMHCVGIYG